jgi:hypothetical protein
MISNSDDNETARYLASYLTENSDRFLTDAHSSVVYIDRNLLEIVIKEFFDNLP